MSNLTKSIASLCHQLIEKPTNITLQSRTAYYKIVDQAKKNPDAPQEIIEKKIHSDFYVNIQNNICINLFKELSVDLIFNEIDQSILEKLQQDQQIIQEGNRSHVAMQDGDIEIGFVDTAISAKISEHKYAQKTGAIIKGEECMIKRVSPGGRDSDRYTLIEATQEDLKAILIGLTELL